MIFYSMIKINAKPERLTRPTRPTHRVYNHSPALSDIQGYPPSGSRRRSVFVSSSCSNMAGASAANIAGEYLKKHGGWASTSGAPASVVTVWPCLSMGSPLLVLETLPPTMPHNRLAPYQRHSSEHTNNSGRPERDSQSDDTWRRFR